MLDTIELPEDWYKIYINKQQMVYVNVRDQICSVGPVFSISKIDQVFNGILGLKVDHQKIEQEVERVRKTLNLMCNTHPLLDLNENSLVSTMNSQTLGADGEIDEKLLDSTQLSLLLQQRENLRINNELDKQVEELDLRIQAELKDIVGDNKDEVSLLNEITGKFFQGIPQYSHHEQSTENPMLRFYCSVRVNGREVGRGVAQNKKHAKQLSAIQALKNICPNLYSQWKVKYRDQESAVSSQSQPGSHFLKEIDLGSLMQQASQKGLIPAMKPGKENQQQLSQNSKDSSQPGYSQDAVSTQDIDDAEIDDPELMYSKKHLCAKYTPLTVVKTLEAKHKNLSFIEQINESKDLVKNKNVYTIIFSIRGFNLEGRATDYSKQRARHEASQRFLKNLFPKNYTWNCVISQLTQLKEPLKEILDLD
eukprot:403376650